jgi:hypothetical protein
VDVDGDGRDDLVRIDWIGAPVFKVWLSVP